MDQLSILWVDDEIDTFVFEIDEMRDWGHYVIIKETLEGAIAAIKQQPFDLVISDQQLFQPELVNDPKVSIWMGCILLRAIRKNFVTITTAPEWVQNKLTELSREPNLADHQNANVYVSFISGFTNSEVTTAIKQSTAEDHSTVIYAKPITEHIIKRIVDIALQRKQQQQ